MGAACTANTLNPFGSTEKESTTGRLRAVLAICTFGATTNKREAELSATRSRSPGAQCLNGTRTSVLSVGEHFSRNSIDTASMQS